MSQIRQNYKLLFAGPPAAGKTTAINALSDIDPVLTDVKASDRLSEVKATTTVALDYGLLNLGDNERVHLFGAPGQERFDFMWEILSGGVLGVCLLFHNARPQPLEDLDQYLAAFRTSIDNTQLVIGVTHMDVDAPTRLADYHRRLQQHGLRAPVLEVDARERRDVAALVQAMLYSLSVRFI